MLWSIYETGHRLATVFGKRLPFGVLLFVTGFMLCEHDERRHAIVTVVFLAVVVP